MKKLLIEVIIVFVSASLLTVLKYLFFGSVESIWTTFSYYFVLFTLIEIVRLWLNRRYRKNRERLNKTKSEEEKAIFNSLGAQVKPFKAEDADILSDKS